MNAFAARFRAFLERLFGVREPEPEPNLWDVWADLYDRAPGSPEEQEAWLELQLSSMERRERAA
ncbi:hypothetical protein [Deinococcus sp. QL22]|uniref:hypothetical protein n=1 Tax=Deinococcus sp. QL22 TaxID=2939437 RepID=UPI002017C815|nr:hypothetical protein [Deinococcus sp. QL22]UQN06798.1 hypothetical protein M1R55_02420 [Deinococcus sp. QL22]